MSTKACFRGKAFLGEPATITFEGCELMDQIQTVVWQFFCTSIGRSYFRGKAFRGKPSKITFRRQQGCCPERSCDSWQVNKLQYVDTRWHFIFNLLHLSFGQWLYVRGCRAERVARSADTLDKSQEAQLPNPRSISLGNPWLPKWTAQLPSLNLVNRMCLSNADFEVQSAGYNSAQSPTNWESIHSKDPSILCRLSSRLSIALSDESPKGEIQNLFVDTRNL